MSYSKSSVNSAISYAGNWYTAGSASAPPSNYFIRRSWTDSVVFGDNVRDYRRVIRQGGNATTSLSGTRYSLEPYRAPRRLYQHYRNNLNGYVYSSTRFIDNLVNNIPSAGADPGIMSAADNIAASNFYKSVERAYKAFAAGQALGELGETLRMIKNPAKAFREGVDSYLSSVGKTARKYKKKTDVRKAVADSYLEYAFGWAPLIGDAKDAMNYLERRKEQLEREFVPVSGRGHREGSSVYTQMATGGNFKVYYEYQTHDDCSVRYKGVIDSTALGSSTVTAASLGLRLDDFVPTAWELLPWSFLIDYFTNVGDVLTAYSYRRTRLRWGWKGTRGIRSLIPKPARVAYVDDFTSNITMYSKSDSGGAMSRTSRTDVTRSKVTYVPIPDFQFEIPGVGTKWINMSALLASRRRLTPFKPSL